MTMLDPSTPAPVSGSGAPGPVGSGRRPPALWFIVATMARTDLARLVRDPVALFFIVVMPVVIMIIIGATFGQQRSHLPVGVIDHDQSEASAQLVQALRTSDLIDVRIYTGEDDLAQDIRIQTMVGGLTIPSGYGAGIERGEGARVTVLADQKQSTAATLTTVLGSIVDREGQALAAANFAAARTGGDRAATLDRARTIQLGIEPIAVAVSTTGEASLSSTNQYSYTAPSNLVLFVFINSITGATALVESRRLGVTRRMLAAPITVGAIVLGAGFTRLLVALIQAMLILLIGSLVFGVDWGDPLGVAVLVLVFALLSTGAGLLIGSIATKPEQVPALGIPLAISFAMLGGCMWPLEIVPPPLQVVGHLTPHAWAMDAWITLGFEGGGLGAIALDVGVLAGAAAVLLALAAWRLRRSLLS